MRQYKMFNGFNNKLLEDDPIIEARNGSEAVKKLLVQLNISYTKIIRSSSNYVRISAHPLDNGKVSWYEIWNGDCLL